MKHMLKKLLLLIISMVAIPAFAASTSTNRVPQFSNDKVAVWETIIYPGSQHLLAMHRHDHDRVIVALSDGVLKVRNNADKIHFITYKKGKSYYFPKDVPNEMHTDENTTSHPIKVVVMELKG